MEINIEQNNMMNLNNGGFAYDGFFHYSGVSLYSRVFLKFLEIQAQHLLSIAITI